MANPTATRALKVLPLALAAILASGDVPPASAAAPAPRLEIGTARIEAGPQLNWIIPFKIMNSTNSGLYTDSAHVVVESLDEGETRTDRKQTLPMRMLKAAIQSLSAGDTVTYSYTLPALYERARVTVHYFGHGQGGRKVELTAVSEMVPGVFSRQHPSRLVAVGERQVECVLVSAMRGGDRAPAVLLVHGEASHARLQFPLARQLAERGYAVMLVSQPGYGRSSGPADFAGPATLAALEAALRELKASPRVDSSRIAVWGISRGATAALLLAGKHPEIRVAIGQAGIYDLWAVHRETGASELKETIVREAGSDSAAWKQRSPLVIHPTLSAAVLLLHGEADTRVPVAQAMAYFASLHSGPSWTQAKFYPGAGHLLGVDDALERADEFMNLQLSPR